MERNMFVREIGGVGSFEVAQSVFFYFSREPRAHLALIIWRRGKGPLLMQENDGDQGSAHRAVKRRNVRVLHTRFRTRAVATGGRQPGGGFSAGQFRKCRHTR